MTRLALTAVLVAGGFLAWAGELRADNPASVSGGFSGGTAKSHTMTLGGQGTAASAAATDNEQAWYHGYRRGYWHGYYNGYYGGFAPYYAGYYPYAYSYAYPYSYYAPPVVGYYGPYGRVAVGIYGINGTRGDLASPAVTLTLGSSVNPLYQGKSASPTPAPAYPYDGGPASPIPQPQQDTVLPGGQTNPPSPAVGLPVSLPRNPQTTKPYAYKAYGEK
jgi:hypothetical protein